MTIRLVVLFLILMPRAALAQDRGVSVAPDSCSPPAPALNDSTPAAPSDDPFASFLATDRIDYPPQRLPFTHGLRYPARLQDAGIGGNITFEFVVDSAGLVDICSARVLSVSDSAFLDPGVDYLSPSAFVRRRAGAEALGSELRKRFSGTRSADTPSPL